MNTTTIFLLSVLILAIIVTIIFLIVHFLHKPKTTELSKIIAELPPEQQQKVRLTLNSNLSTAFSSNSFLLGMGTLENKDYVPTVPKPLRLYSSSSRTPVIFVPGLCGSQLYCKWKFSESPLLCMNSGADQNLWITALMLLPESLGGKCWKRRMLVYWDKTYKNIQGMTSWPNGFGTMKGVDYLSDQPIFNKVITYFNTTSAYLRQLGYKDGQDMFAAPYEFRLILDETVMDKFIGDLKKLVEYAYRNNGNKKVALMGHSCGCPLSHTFLLRMSKEWKDTYIQKFISIAGPYGGASRAFRTMMSGDNLGIPGKQLVFRDIGRSMACIFWMLPNETVYKGLDIMKVGQKRYTLDDYPEMMGNIGLDDQYFHSLQYKKTMFQPNGVKTELITPSYEPTELQYAYNKNIDEDPEIIDETVFHNKLAATGQWPFPSTPPSKALGDGTVPFLSLYAPLLSWPADSISKHISINADHVGVIRDAKFLQYLAETLH